MERTARIFVAGHGGLVGSALVRELQRQGYEQIITRSRRELDLTDQNAVRQFFAAERPQFVFLAAARVGGILANNTFPAQFIYENLAIETNVIDAAYRTGVTKLLFLGSSCIYPKFADQPLREEYLLSGSLEPTNEPYAIAKIAGVKMCEAYNRQYGTRFISVMPTNLYGPGDNFDLETSHVIPALLRKFHTARIRSDGQVVVWGTGQPRREFLHVDDLAAACIFLMKGYAGADIVNIGVGEDVSIAELARLIGEIAGFTGEIVFDSNKPDGTPRKLLDVSRLHALGWRAAIPLRTGLASTYAWYVARAAAESSPRTA